MKQQLGDLISRGRGKRVLCVGDLMLDRFVYGTVDRISPESPVPVMRRASTLEMPGGAGNVARNMAAMGLLVTVVGCVGEDEDGAILGQILKSHEHIDTLLASSSEVPTIVKSRFVANNQQLLRVDDEPQVPEIGAAEAVLCSAIEKAAGEASLIVVSDYAKGAITDRAFAACLAAGRAEGIPVIVDPKSKDLARYAGAQLVKPNAAELGAATGLPSQTDREIEAALNEASRTLPGSSIVVTRAGKGMSWLEDGEVSHRRGEARQVFDVSGAGDTSMAAIALGLVAGATLDQAVALAVKASGLAVAKAGTATVAASELQSAIASQAYHARGPVVSRDDASALVQTWKAQGLKVGFTNGCFDLLHAGHLSLLEAARARCDRLIVAINSDASVTRLKGPQRPVNTEQDRASILSALGAVDAVTIFEEDTPAALIDALLPDLLVKGGDYTVETIVGADTVQRNGGEVLVVGLLEGRSTTAMLQKSQS